MNLFKSNLDAHRRWSIILMGLLLWPATVLAQQATLNVAGEEPGNVELTAAAIQRIEATVRSSREAKAAVAPEEVQTFGVNPLLPQLSSAPISYVSNYQDTQAGDDFSFPEDTHDFCRAAYDPSANQDYYLNAVVLQPGTYTATLAWAGGGDYDIYVFDEDGRQAGDPAGQFPNGASGISFQPEGAPLQEQASLEHAGTEAAMIIVVDRYRGPETASLTVTVDGVDGTYNVLEYLGNTSVSYVDAAANSVLEMLTEGATIDTTLFSTSPRSYNFEFAIDDCAESAVFELTDSTGAVIATGTDNDLPFTLFGDTPAGDGTDYNGQDLAPGEYTITVTPFGNDDGQGASGEPYQVTFTIPEPEDEIDPGTITAYSLVNALTDEVVPGFENLQDGAVIDLLTLDSPDDLNILATVSGDVDDVAFSLLYNDGGWSDVASAAVSPDAEEPYSVYGGTGGDFASALIPIGSYTLTGVASLAGGNGVPNTINFTVIGPRISSYSLIRIDNSGPTLPDGTDGYDLPVAGFDPILEGAVIDLAAIDAQNPAEGYSIRANTLDFDEPRIESIRFNLTSTDVNVEDYTTRESARPYSLFGDFNEQFQAPPNGTNLSNIDPDSLTNYTVWPSPVAAVYTLEGLPDDVNPGDGFAHPFGSLVLNFELSSAVVARTDAQAKGLFPNFPNPFNPTTTIRFTLEETAPVTLVVVDLLGREVRRLVDGVVNGGVHSVVFDAGSLASGMYFYRLETPDFKQVRLMTLMK